MLFQFPSQLPGTSCPPWWPSRSQESWKMRKHDWYEKVNYLFSTRRYHDRWPLIPTGVLDSTGVPSPYSRVDTWLFFIPADRRSMWDVDRRCLMCTLCRDSI
eukprot:6362720-Alexandrium_andersonii.AAC.1